MIEIFNSENPNKEDLFLSTAEICKQSELYHNPKKSETTQTQETETITIENLPSAPLKLDEYQKNVDYFWENINPFFYDRTNIFWVWNKNTLTYKQVDEVDIMNI